MNTPFEKPKLVFVYNAASGIFNLLSDVAHKILSPETYACNLCAITHTNFGMKKEWKEYLESLERPLEFLHADEFEAKYKRGNVELPAIFKEENGDLILAVSAAAINGCRTVDDLKDCLQRSNLQKA
jgi:hypothetical protein